MSDSVRLDKWLWAARFFKTRGVATEAVSGGHIHLNQQRAKPSKGVKVGDELTINRGGNEQTIIIQSLSERRGPAKVAQTLYEETQDSIDAREKNADLRKYHRMGLRPAPSKPNSRDRRRLRALSGKE